mmetsp:Transcript_15612/g.24960  ORF Transcript_15612/g.24960 Transcript_15612/m.24960 type:complete len:80 (+) Transcript_15612:186-425(+)
MYCMTHISGGKHTPKHAVFGWAESRACWRKQGSGPNARGALQKVNCSTAISLTQRTPSLLPWSKIQVGSTHAVSKKLPS